MSNTLHITALRQAADDAKANHTRARQAAVEIESDRLRAESNHAQSVADAMETGNPIPGKPAELSKLMAADDSVDAALAILERKEAVAHNALNVAVREYALAEAMKRVEVRSVRVRNAAQAMLAAAIELAKEIGSRRTFDVTMGRVLSRVSEDHLDSPGGFNKDIRKTLGIFANCDDSPRFVIDSVEREASNIPLDVIAQSEIDDEIRAAVQSIIASNKVGK